MFSQKINHHRVSLITVLFLSLVAILLVLTFLLSQSNLAQAQTISASQVLELDAIDSGWYTNVGYHNPDNTNYVVGDCYLPQCSNLVTYRNFFVFDLSGVAGDIVSATLLIENPPDGYNSNDPAETWTTFNVMTPVPTLVAGGSGLTSIYDDLGSGQTFGSAVVISTNTLVPMVVNPVGLSALNAQIGDQFAIGGAITTLDGDLNREWIFGNGNEVYVRKLLLGMAAPITMTINYPDGAPGSYFTLLGSGFPPNSTATITLNGRSLGTIPTDADGSFTFLLNSTGADEGDYFLTATVNPSANISFTLDETAPIHPQDGTGTTFDIPAGIAFNEFVFLPTVVK